MEKNKDKEGCGYSGEEETKVAVTSREVNGKLLLAKKQVEDEGKALRGYGQAGRRVRHKSYCNRKGEIGTRRRRIGEFTFWCNGSRRKEEQNNRDEKGKNKLNKFRIKEKN